MWKLVSILTILLLTSITVLVGCQKPHKLEGSRGNGIHHKGHLMCAKYKNEERASGEYFYAYVLMTESSYYDNTFKGVKIPQIAPVYMYKVTYTSNEYNGSGWKFSTTNPLIDLRKQLGEPVMYEDLGEQDMEEYYVDDPVDNVSINLYNEIDDDVVVSQQTRQSTNTTPIVSSARTSKADEEEEDVDVEQKAPQQEQDNDQNNDDANGDEGSDGGDAGGDCGGGGE